MGNIIEVRKLKKSYKDVIAVNSISFNVKEGEFFAFLGINGAGKSTTINMITGILNMDEGDILVDNVNVLDNSLLIKSEIGVVFQDSGLDQFLSVYENLYYRGKLYSIKDSDLKQRIDKIATELEFKEFLNRPLNKLSGGQKRKIDLARALIHEPKIVILDEPTTGLDPKTRQHIWKYLNNLRENKKLTIFLTTHYMEEASQADTVVIIDEGNILTQGTPNQLKQKYAKDYLKIYKSGVNKSNFKEFLSKYKKKIREENEYYLVNIKDTKEVKDILSSYPNSFDDFEVYKGSMDDVFLNVTGKEIGEENE